MVVARHLRANLSEEGLADVRERIAKYVEQTEKLSVSEHAGAKIMCPLLSSDGKCSIHPARPMSCRWTHAFYPSQCKAVLEADSDGIIDADLQSLIWGRSVVRGLRAGLREADLDDRRYELHSALLRALDREGPEEEWIAGNPVFEGCKVLSES